MSYQVGVVAGDFDLAGSDGIAQSNVKHPMLVQLVTYGNQKTPGDFTNNNQFPTEGLEAS